MGAESADNRVLHRAGSENQLTIASRIVREARNSRQSFLISRLFDEERSTSLMETWGNFYLLGAHIPEVWPFPKILRICSAAKELNENPLQQSQLVRINRHSRLLRWPRRRDTKQKPALRNKHRPGSRNLKNVSRQPSIFLLTLKSNTIMKKPRRKDRGYFHICK